MRLTWIALVVLTAMPLIAISEPPPVVTIVGSFSKPRTWDGRIDMPYFDAQNRLRWNDERVSDAGDCTVAWFHGAEINSARCGRETVMLNPRVDECRCTGKTSSGVGTAISYAGIDNSSRERWRRYRMGADWKSGPRLVGATPNGLVFDNFEVWSPDTGDSIRSATKLRGSYDTTCYLPERNIYLLFDADVTLFHAKGGLFIHTLDGRRELMLPVESTLLGHYRVESIAPVPGTSLILLGERYSTRGPGGARFQLFDLESRKVVFQDERSEDHYAAYVRVIAGADGHVGFSYLDENTAQYHVVHYHIQNQP